MTVEIYPTIVVGTHWSRTVHDTCSGTWQNTYEAVVPANENRRANLGKVLREWKSPPGPRVSWRDVKESGFIRMTDYSRGRSSKENYIGSIDRNSYFYYEMCTRDVPANSPCTRSNLVLDGVSNWTQRGDLAYWRDTFPTAPTYTRSLVLDPAEVERALSSAFSDLFVGYDALTELAELSRTSSEVVSILEKAKLLLLNFRKTSLALKDKYRRQPSAAAKAVGDLWLEYQYGIMPLVFSVKDILALSKARTFITERRRVSAEYVDEVPASPPDTYFITEMTGSIQASVTCKGRWSAGLAVSDRINFNPFLTAWELIPYSFVIDWFVNVGDFLASRLSGLASNNEQSVGCIAIRSNYWVSTYLVYKINETTSFSRYKPAESGCSAINYNVTRGGVKSGSLLLSAESVDSYARTVRQPKDVQLVFLPSLKWERILTAISLAVGSSIRGLRSLHHG